MSRFDAIVIGAGINGLAAATVLARRGKSVCILEQSDRIGGMATLRAGDAPELASLLYNLSPVALKDMGLDAKAIGTGPEVPTIALDPGGDHVVVRRGRATTLSGDAHPDAQVFRSLHDRLVRYGELLRRLAEAPPPVDGAPLLSVSGLRQALRLARLGLGVRRLGKPEMRRFLQVLLSNAYDLILDELPEGPLAGLMAADAVRGAAMGPRSPGTVFGLIYRLGHSGRVTLPEGGMSSVMDDLSRAAQSAGCTLRTGAAVTRICLENDAVTGVETSTGETLEARTVLSSLGPKGLTDLAGIGSFDIEAARRVRSLRTRGTVARVAFRLKDDAVPNLPGELMPARIVLAPSADYVERAFTPSKYGEMSDDPVIEAVPVKGADGATWLAANVQYAPTDLSGGWTEKARARLVDRALTALAAPLPDLPAAVTGTQVMTPDQIEAATGATGGHWHHADMALDQLFTLRPGNRMARYAMGPRGLFLCGAAAHPGGDVMGLAGRNAALAVLEGLA